MSNSNDIKRILLIGNGFDLEHDLPTSYVDFIEFVHFFRLIAEGYTNNIRYKIDIKDWDGNENVKKLLFECSDDKSRKNPKSVSGKMIVEENKFRNEKYVVLKENLEKNIWLKYFTQLYCNNLFRGKNWIDFESEISYVVSWMETSDLDIYSPFSVLYDMLANDDKTDEKKYYFSRCISSNHTEVRLIEEFINLLYEDLERFICAFEAYLTYFVEPIEIKARQFIEEINPDYVVSFNYTHTFERRYTINNKVCYIHGSCRDAVIDNDTNIVLGIEETLSGDEKDRNTDYAIFKKFIQRIRKRNDTTYKEVLKQIEKTYNDVKKRKGGAKSNENYSNGHVDIYVYGHSLDITDKDILRDFLEPEYTDIHIFVQDKIQEGKLISNILRIIGEDKLITKANNSPTQVEFIRIVKRMDGVDTTKADLNMIENNMKYIEDKLGIRIEKDGGIQKKMQMFLNLYD